MATNAQLLKALMDEAGERRAANPALGQSDREVAVGMVLHTMIPAVVRYAGQTLQPGQSIEVVESLPGVASIRIIITAETPLLLGP